MEKLEIRSRNGVNVELDLFKTETEEKGKLPELTGYASVFDVFEDSGFFLESVRTGAFDNTIRTNASVTALFEHDWTKILGRTIPKTLKLETDKKGLFVRIFPPNTELGKEMVELVQRQDLVHMSIGFRVIKQEWDYETEPWKRTIIEMDLKEVSLTARPVFHQTSITTRSIESVFNEEKLSHQFNPSFLKDQLKMRDNRWKIKAISNKSY